MQKNGPHNFILMRVSMRRLLVCRGGGRKRLPKFKFSAKFPIGLHVILQIQIKNRPVAGGGGVRGVRCTPKFAKRSTFSYKVGQK